VPRGLPLPKSSEERSRVCNTELSERESQGPYRWLTGTSPEDPDGTELQLALNDNPAANAYQQAIFQQSQPAAMFFTDDVQADYERMKARGAEFTMPPTDVTASKIAMLNDTCGNLIQVTQLMRW
jgi:Glyoxalase/Bleomycin resistance protein/Dioxygenase superfamily